MWFQSIGEKSVKNYSVSTLIIPTKDPLLVTVGYVIFPLLSTEQLQELIDKQIIELNYDKLKTSIKFYLYNNDKVTSDNENNKQNFVELRPKYLMLP